MNRLPSLSFIFIMAVVMLIITEIVGRYGFPNDLELVRNPDHRLLPNTYETNSDGIRSDKEAEEFKAEDLNIIFLGDSFVYGLLQNPEMAFPQQYERLARARHPGCRISVANFGWHSSSPYLSLRLLREIGSKYSPDVVFLGIDMTDFHDDLKYRYLIERPTFIYKGLAYLPGVIILTKKIFNKLDRFDWVQKLHEQIFGLPLDRFFIVNEPLEDTEEFGSAIFDSILEIAEFADTELNSKFIVILLPRSFQYSDKESPKNWEKGSYQVLGPYSLEPFRLFEERKDSMDFPIYSLLPDFQTTEIFPTVMYDDPHWTWKGNRFVAETVYDLSTREGLWSCGRESAYSPLPSDVDSATLD